MGRMMDGGAFEARKRLFEAKRDALVEACRTIAATLWLEMSLDHEGCGVDFHPPAHVPPHPTFEPLLHVWVNPDTLNVLPDGFHAGEEIEHAHPSKWKAAVMGELISTGLFTSALDAEYLEHAYGVFSGDIIIPESVMA